MDLQLSRKGKGRVPKDDPTSSLNSALAKFQDVLTKEQKQQFKDSALVPDAEGVLFFVAKLDAENSSKTRRSIAPRLCTFLNSTQQFAGVVETFVSSNPKIAALVWGGIKTAITVASNVASYFDKVTNLIMEIGLVCPTFQEFGHIYHGCVGLQNALCDYYAIIIELCIKIVEISRRTLAAQTLSSIWNPFESEFKSFLDRLKIARENIELQIRLASAQVEQESKRLLESERQENASFRPSALNFLRKSASQQKETRKWQINQMKRETASLKTQVRQNLSSIDHIRPWKRYLKQRVHLTAEWLTKESSFLEWKNCPETAIFWCSGTMGMGKTVLMSNVVSYLHSSRKNNETISHFFCSSEIEDSLSARSIFGSISRQLLEIFIERSAYDSLSSMQQDTQALDTSEIIEFLLSKLDTHRTYYIVLDGLDECEPAQILEISRALKSLCYGNTRKMKIVCAGRPDLEEDLFKWTKPHFRLIIDEGKLGTDIDRYITASLDGCLEEELLVVQNQSIITQIFSALRENSQGMFLWVGLCINDLCESNCDEDILGVLSHLPRGLTELFNSKLRRIQEGKNGLQAIRLLQYCGAVKRPLTVDEYREALIISVDDKFLDTKKLPNSMNRIIRGCYGLAFVDDEDDTVHYVHQSVKEHLFHAEHAETSNFDIEGLDKHMGLLCITYLNFLNLSHQVTEFDKGGRGMVDPLQVGTLPIYGNDPLSDKIIRKIIPQKEQSVGIEFREFQRIALESVGKYRSRFPGTETATKSFSFLLYAKAYWFMHLKELKEEDGNLSWSLFTKCIEDKTLPIDRPWESSVLESSLGFVLLSEDGSHRRESEFESFAVVLCSFLRCQRSELIWIFEQNHFGLFLYLLKRNKELHAPWKLSYFPPFTNGSTHRWVNMLIEARYSNHIWSSVIRNVTEDPGLAKASRFGVIFEMLQKIAKLNKMGARFALGMGFRHALLANDLLQLMLAVDRALYPTASVLNENLDRKFAHWSNIGETQRVPVLKVATLLGCHEKVKELLDAGADFTTRDESGKTALSMAVRNHDSSPEFSYEQIKTIQVLVAAGARLTCSEISFDLLVSAAFAIAKAVDATQAKSLLTFAGIDFNMPLDSGLTALQMIVSISDTYARLQDILNALVAAGADINLRGSLGTTPLGLAVLEERKKMTEILLAAGANANARNNANDPVIHTAVAQGNHSMTKILVDAGADVNLRDHLRQTPLHLALIQGRKEIVRAFEAEGEIPGLQSLLDTYPTSPGTGSDPDMAHGKYGAALEKVYENKRAIEFDIIRMVKLLLNAGADVNAKTSAGMTALDLASSYEQRGVIVVLKASQRS